MKKHTKDTVIGFSAISVGILVAVYFLVSAGTKSDCPHEAKRKAEAEEVKAKDKARAELHRDTVTLLTTNGTSLRTNVYWMAFGDVPAVRRTNISELPNVQKVRVCKHCGDVVERTDYPAW